MTWHRTTILLHTPMTILAALIQSLSRTGEYSPDDQVVAAAILCPDKERQWEPGRRVLRGRSPHLFTPGAPGGNRCESRNRWTRRAPQPIGWHPDLIDGVRLNIRPFTEADLSAGGQAGVLRKRPNTKWGKDRGMNPPDSPGGEKRDNDQHLTLAETMSARERTAAGRSLRHRDL